MKILHVLYSGLGGHGNVFFSFIGADKKKEFKYEALFYGIEDVRSEYIQKCIEKNIVCNFAKKKYKIDFKFYLQIFKYIRRSGADIILLHGSAYIIPSVMVKLLSKKKLNIVVRETQANHLKAPMQWIVLFLSMAWATKVVCLTKEFKDQIVQKFSFLNNKKIIVIANGIDLNLFKPAEENNSQFFIIGMQSRLVSIKDHITLLKAFAIIKRSNDLIYKNLKLKIAGEGSFKNTLIQQTKELGLERDVEFSGELSENELIRFLQSLNIYVHASLGETMSTAIMQAMACKLPVIASDVNGINNMIADNSTGLLVPVKNEVALAAALEKCIINKELRNILALNAYNYAINHYSNDTMFESYKRMFFA
ncbi:MAG TPA: glycosyltransferase family 4 protein [Chitinophagaceae bacterium]|nr:glycosyltransferase family 4 protein [Chitinophagaceae bacterium]